MSKSKKYQRRVVNVISTDSLGKFIFEFRESTETDIYTVHTIVTDWESAAPAFPALVANLTKAGKPKMVIIVAIMRKLAKLCYYIHKSGKPFDKARYQTA